MPSIRRFFDLGGKHRAEPMPPEPDGLVADVDAGGRTVILS